MAIERASLPIVSEPNKMFPAAQTRSGQGEAEGGGQRRPRRREPPAEDTSAVPATDGRGEGEGEDKNNGDKKNENENADRSSHRIDSIA